MSEEHTKAFRIEIVVLAAPGASIKDVESLVADLTWVGGCRDPDEDPMFSSVTIQRMSVKRSRNLKGSA